MAEVTWTIHGIYDTEETFNEQEHKEHPYMGNFHTHGLNEYNNQRAVYRNGFTWKTGSWIT